MGIALAWIGFVVQLAGLGLALVGLRRTRLAYAPDLPGTFDWLVIPARNSWRRIVVAYNRVTHRAIHGSIGAATGHVTFSGSATGHFSVVYGPYDPSLSVEDQLRLLDARLRADHETLNRIENESASLRRDLTATEKLIDSAQVELREHVQVSVRSLAVGGIRGAVWGLLLTLVGTVIADLPALIPALA
jgi:hypothetical protein